MNLLIVHGVGLRWILDIKRNTNDVAKRLAIQEKALSSLADSFRKYKAEAAEEIRDLQAELKTLKMFLARTTPDFKKQFPEIQQKLR